MPAIVGPEDYERWLMPETDAKDLLRPSPAERMTAWPISTRVNSPRNEGAELLEAVEA
jgi:putative SOS response-associated peptidase YedK